MSTFQMAREGDMGLFEHIDTMAAHEKSRCIRVAAQFGQVNIVKHFLEQHPPNDDDIKISLFCAAHDNKSNVVSYLIDHCADILDPQDLGHALMYAAQQNNHELIDQLLKKDVDGCKFLRVAAKQRNEELFEKGWHKLKNPDYQLIALLYAWGKTDHIQQCLTMMTHPQKNEIFINSVIQDEGLSDYLFDHCKEGFKDNTYPVLPELIYLNQWALAEKALPYSDADWAVQSLKDANIDIALLEHMILKQHTQDQGRGTMHKKM